MTQLYESFILLVMQPVDNEELLSPAEVARLFGVQPQTIVRWSKEGKITAIRTPGRHRRFRRVDVDELLAKEAS